MNKYKLVGFSVALVFALSSCQTIDLKNGQLPVKKTIAQGNKEMKALLDQGVGVTSVAPKSREGLKQVAVPAHAPWLADSVTAGYKNIRASAAIKRLVGGRAVRLLLKDKDRDVLVYSPSKAVTIQEHLKSIMVQADWSYEVVDGVVVVRDVALEYIRILALPGTRSVTLDIDSLGGENESSSTENKLVSSTNPYESLASALLGIGIKASEEAGSPSGFGQGVSAFAAPSDFSGDGSESTVDTIFSIIPSVGLVTIEGRPSKISQARKVVDWFNASHSAKAVAEIAIFEVQLTQEKLRELSLDISRSGKHPSSLSLAGSAGGVAASDGLKLNVDITNPLHQFAGSTSMVNWLNKYGQSSLSIRRQTELKSNELVTIESRQNNPFVEEVSRDSLAIGTTTSTAPSVTLGNEDTGWALNVLPMIDIDRDEVSMKINTSRAVRVDDFSYSFDDGAIAGGRPILNKVNEVHHVTVKSGETKIVSILEFNAANDDTSRTPLLPVLGDGVNQSGTVINYVMTVSVSIEP